MSILSEEQISSIIETWKIPAANLIDSGDYILFKFFEKYPKNQNYFVRFRNIPVAELKGKPAFRAHASRIMNAFAATIDCLAIDGGWDEVRTLWQEIGASHGRRRIPRKAFMELKSVLVEVLSDVCSLNDEQKEAWGALLEHLYQWCFETLGNH